jgi:ribosome biogenesis GTPase / thiamine phosphate phosphatase
VPSVSPPVAPALAQLGWDERWAQTLAAEPRPSLTPGRVSRIDRGVCTILTDTGPLRAATERAMALAVGDWVTLQPGSGPGDPDRVARVLPRRTAFHRTTDRPGASPQVVAANIDTVLLVTAVDGHLSARHLERYLALAWQSGAVPVVVISKADLASAESLAEWTASTEAAAGDAAICVVSAFTRRGVEGLAAYLEPGRTVALLGLSGAGKSTLVNLLAGAPVLAVGDVRADGQGRHTTTYRELVLLPGRGLVIDTPGMRALSVAGAVEGVRRAFTDLEELAATCAFADCSHRDEAGCAVRAAVKAGEVDGRRLASWRRLLAQGSPPDPESDREAGRQQVDDRKRRKVAAKTERRRLSGVAHTAASAAPTATADPR